jgi:UDP-N-acetyl-D-mannosaminuronate dehydrogenase
MACLPEVDAIVVGVGRLGLCFALTLERAGLSVVGVDVSSDYCARLNNKAFESDEPRLEDMLRDATRFHATTDLTAAARRARLIFVFVPTPTRGGKQLYDHAHVSSVLQHLNELRLEDTDVVINATVMPGYIRTVGRFLLRECPSVTLSYNPAFVAQGDVMDGCVLAVMSPCNRLVPPARTRSRAAARALQLPTAGALQPGSHRSGRRSGGGGPGEYLPPHRRKQRQQRPAEPCAGSGRQRRRRR